MVVIARVRLLEVHLVAIFVVTLATICVALLAIGVVVLTRKVNESHTAYPRKIYG